MRLHHTKHHQTYVDKLNAALEKYPEVAKKPIEELFNVHVRSISTNIVKGKKRMVGRKRLASVEPDKKKARVKLAAGEKIDLFEAGQTT